MNEYDKNLKNKEYETTVPKMEIEGWFWSLVIGMLLLALFLSAFGFFYFISWVIEKIF